MMSTLKTLPKTRRVLKKKPRQKKMLNRSSSLPVEETSEIYESESNPSLEEETLVDVENLKKFSNIPGNMTQTKYLDKKTFENSHTMGSTIEVKDGHMTETAYRKTYKELRKAINQDEEEDSQEKTVKIIIEPETGFGTYFDAKGMIEKHQIKPNKLIVLSDNVNSSTSLINPSYLPKGKNKM